MRSLPDPGFAGDDGGVDPRLSTALAAYDESPEADEADRRHAALAVLQDARVVVPVVAVLGEVECDEQGLARDKTSDMAAVLMTGRDGRTALLAFTGSASLARWNPEARPVPVPLRQAAQAALQDGAAALLVDVAGPVLFVVEGEDLVALASGHRLVRVEDHWGWASAEG
jgi:hypothetical protein